MKVNCHEPKTDISFKSRRWTEVTLLGKVNISKQLEGTIAMRKSSFQWQKGKWFDPDGVNKVGEDH